MKYIKSYENPIVYWRVSTKQPQFRIALKKIGAPNDYIEDLCQDIEHINSKYINVFQQYDFDNEEYNLDWTLVPVPSFMRPVLNRASFNKKEFFAVCERWFISCNNFMIYFKESLFWFLNIYI